MKVGRSTAVAFIACLSASVCADSPPATAPARPPESRPSTQQAAKPLTPREERWVEAATVERGRTWAITFTLQEGTGPAEIRDGVRLDTAFKGQNGLWSRHFASQGFQPGILLSAGGFGGGQGFSAKSVSEKLGTLNWSGSTFADRNGGEQAQMSVQWDRPDGTRSVYTGKAPGGPGGTSSEVFAAGHLLNTFGFHSGVKIRLAPGERDKPAEAAWYAVYEFDVGKGDERKQGVLRLIDKRGFWRLSSEQPSAELLRPAK